LEGHNLVSVKLTETGIEANTTSLGAVTKSANPDTELKGHLFAFKVHGSLTHLRALLRKIFCVIK